MLDRDTQKERKKEGKVRERKGERQIQKGMEKCERKGKGDRKRIDEKDIITTIFKLSKINIERGIYVERYRDI